MPTELTVTDVLAAIKTATPKPAMVSSLLSAKLEVIADGDMVFVTPMGTDIMAKVVDTDVKTCVGTVHVVDAVLVPAVPGQENQAPSGSYGDVM